MSGHESPYAANEFSPDRENSWSAMFELIPDGARVLDVGCSSGNFGAALQRLKGCTVVGIDVNAQDVAIAATRLSAAHVLDVTDGDGLESLGRFDVVVVADVLEHLVDPDAALAGLRTRLTADGIVVYSIPHMGHLSVRLDLLEGRFPYTDLGLLDRTHLHFYDRVEVHDLFARSGFAVVTESPVLARYPQEWIDGRLADLGLAASPVTRAMFERTDAEVYQFVGVAVPRATRPVRPAALRDRVAPPDTARVLAAELQQRNRELLDENERLTAQVSSLVRDVAELRYLTIPHLLELASDDDEPRSQNEDAR